MNACHSQQKTLTVKNTNKCLCSLNLGHCLQFHANHVLCLTPIVKKNFCHLYEVISGCMAMFWELTALPLAYV